MLTFHSVIGVDRIALLVSHHPVVRLVQSLTWPGIKRQTECRYAHVANLLEYGSFRPLLF